MGIKISNLGNVGTIGDNDLIPIVQSGVTSNVKFSVVSASISGGTGSTLANTLTAGNTTSGKNIVISSGDTITSPINSGNTIELDYTGFNNNFTAGVPRITSGQGSVTVSSKEIEFRIGDGNDAAGYTNWNVFSTGETSFSILKNDFTKFGRILLATNEDKDITPFNIPSYPCMLSTQNSGIKQGVINTAIFGGIGITAKTDNTSYVSQIGYSKNLEAFELLISATTPTADRLQTHQDKDGTIALLSDNPMKGVFTTVGRPSVGTLSDGDYYMDTTLGKPIWVLSGNYIDAAGTIV